MLCHTDAQRFSLRETRSVTIAITIAIAIANARLPGYLPIVKNQPEPSPKHYLEFVDIDGAYAH